MHADYLMHAGAVNPNGIKTLLANGLIVFFIFHFIFNCIFKGKSVLSNGPKRLPKNHPDCPIFNE